MNQLQHLIEQLQDTDSLIRKLDLIAEQNPENEIYQFNIDSIKKRRSDLERRLNKELRFSQADLVQYHIAKEKTDSYPVKAVAKTIFDFQELITSVFDALRTTPKQRYTPSTESIELSSLEFSMALPVNSILISMSIQNERFLLIESELDKTFANVFEILKATDSDKLRELASKVGIASISKAHHWAQETWRYGLDTKITISKNLSEPLEFEISKSDALALKEAIEQKSEQFISQENIIGELVGIDVERPGYFHIRSLTGEDVGGKLSETFQTDAEWVININYIAHLSKISTVKYSTGEEKIDWILEKLTVRTEE